MLFRFFPRNNVRGGLKSVLVWGLASAKSGPGYIALGKDLQ